MPLHGGVIVKPAHMLRRCLVETVFQIGMVGRGAVAWLFAFLITDQPCFTFCRTILRNLLCCIPTVASFPWVGSMNTQAAASRLSVPAQKSARTSLKLPKIRFIPLTRRSKNLNAARRRVPLADQCGAQLLSTRPELKPHRTLFSCAIIARCPWQAGWFSTAERRSLVRC